MQITAHGGKIGEVEQNPAENDEEERVKVREKRRQALQNFQQEEFFENQEKAEI